MSHECEFCGTIFSKECNLLTHKKKAKYCLIIQGKVNTSHTCGKCGKIFNYHHNLLRHVKTCKSTTLVSKDREFEEMIELKNKEFEDAVTSRDNQIEELNTRIRDLEAELMTYKLKCANEEGQIAVYKERPGIVNGNNYVNSKLLQVKCDTIRPFTIETVREDVREGKYTYDQYIRGERGLIDFIESIFIQDDQRSYVCTDSARNKFHRLLESREWQTDNGATFLNKVFDELSEQATVYYNRICEMMRNPREDQNLANILMDKTKAMYFGIARSKSKERPDIFNAVRNEVRNLAAV